MIRVWSGRSRVEPVGGQWTARERPPQGYGTQQSQDASTQPCWFTWPYAIPYAQAPDGL